MAEVEVRGVITRYKIVESGSRVEFSDEPANTGQPPFSWTPTGLLFDEEGNPHGITVTSHEA